MTTWNVMLVDHDRLFSAALATLIGGGPFRVSAHAASADELQQFAFERIAERPACPKRVFLVEALPVTVVGKIFKQRLRELAAASVYRERVGGECPTLACEVTQDSDGGLWISLTGVPEGQREFCVACAETLGLRVRELVIAPACA